MSQLTSWPIPDLSFVRIGRQEASGAPNMIAELLAQGYQRVYRERHGGRSIKSMEDLLTDLFGKQANLCFATIGNKSGVEHYAGTSMPSRMQPNYSALGNIFGYSDLNIKSEHVATEFLRALISSLSDHIGLVTGVPAHADASKIIEPKLLPRLVTSMQGHQFGMIVLAVPCPAEYVNKEEFALHDQINNVRENKDPKQQQKIDEFLKYTQPYLEHVHLGTLIGLWQVGVYFLSPSRKSFLHLQSIINATYGADREHSMSLHADEIEGLYEHLAQFGLIKNRRTGEFSQTLFAYKFLTPLNSRSLAKYMDLS
jgi:hypothetical protein